MTREELRRFKRIYGTVSDESLSQRFKIGVKHVRRLARQHALAKDKAAFPGDRKMPRWKQGDIDTLVRLYPSTSSLEIAQVVGRSVKSVTALAHRMKLEKEIERLQEMGRENVALRDDR